MSTSSAFILIFVLVGNCFTYSWFESEHQENQRQIRRLYDEIYELRHEIEKP